MHKQTRHGLKIGLPREVCIRPLTIAGAQTECDLLDFSDSPFGHLFLYALVPRLKAEILVNNQRHVGQRSKVACLSCFFQRCAERFLANNGFDTELQSLFDGLQMRWRRRDDIQQIRLYGGQHLTQRFECRCSCGNSLSQIAIGRSDKNGIVKTLPGVVVKCAEIPGAKASNTQLHYPAPCIRQSTAALAS